MLILAPEFRFELSNPEGGNTVIAHGQHLKQHNPGNYCFASRRIAEYGATL